MKICTKCPERGLQPLDNFHKKHGKPQAVCKDCRRAIHAAHYKVNKDNYKSQASERKRELRTWLRELKDNKPCVDCGVNYPAVCMDFDHLDGTDKEACLNVLVSNGVGKDRLEAEIEKCDLVCANCHRLRTEKRRIASMV